MNCSCANKWRSYSNDRLKRARRLYAHFIFERAGVDKRITAICAARAKQRNLYGKSTTVKGIYWSLCCYMSKLDQKTNPHIWGHSRNWHPWMGRFDMWPKGRADIENLAKMGKQQ